MPSYSKEIIEKARELYFKNIPVADIIKTLKINNVRVIYQWRDRFEWDKFIPPESILITTTRHYNHLLENECKTGQDLQELERLANIILKLEEVEILKNTPSKNSKQAKKKSNNKKNNIDHIISDDFERVANKILYTHQRIIYDAGKDPQTYRNRIILKPRQVGGTFGLAFEAFENAVLKGHNQIFISATKAQAEVFKSYISIIATDFFDCEVSGKPGILSNGAELHYLSPNSNAQSRSGDVYFDEIFWCANWKKMESYAAPMATQTQYKKTYISTPSSISHEAYDYWSGERFNAFRASKDQVEINLDLKSLKKGRKDSDGFWRFAFTAQDVIKWGFINKETGKCRINLDQLRLETDPSVFPCIFECQFIDDTNSVFNLKEILKCGVDTQKWTDFNPDAERPFGNKETTAGYDPAGVGDNASFVVLSKPQSVDEKFRLLKDNNWRGIPAPSQCALLEKETERFNIANMAVDNTGPGIFVGDFVEDIYPTVKRLHYSPEQKSRLVQKGSSVIKLQRFEYDENNKNVPLAFMTIHLTFTPKTRQFTYQSSRNKRVGHGDLAWAILDAMIYEHMKVDRQNILEVEIYN